MSQPVTTATAFKAEVRRAIKERVPGAKLDGVTSRKITYPTGAKGFLCRGTVTGKGVTAGFTATGIDGRMMVTFFDERPV